MPRRARLCFSRIIDTSLIWRKSHWVNKRLQRTAFDYPPIKLVQYSGAAFTDGVETHRRDQVELRVYSVAKTVADCFKHRNKIGLDVALEALRDARRQKKASADDLWRYAKICRVANVMRPYLEVIE